MWGKGQLTCKRIGAESLVETPLSGSVPFVDSCMLLRLGSGPPNKSVSRELPGEKKREDMQFEKTQRTLCRLKQTMVLQS